MDSTQRDVKSKQSKRCSEVKANLPTCDSQEDWWIWIHIWPPTLWDTTDSFHFSSIGELTLTPYDFSILTGLRVGVGGPIPCDLDMTQWRAAQHQLLGAIPDITSHGMVRYNWFYDHFSESQLVTPDEVAQYTRGFLMYLLSTTLFANRENTVGLYLLGALVHLS
ncbi:hypothetical protein ACSBR1_036192 [Camellia fascicularis]